MVEMRYRLLGTSGLRVSQLALGTMTFGSDAARRLGSPTPGASWSWCAGEDEARRIFAHYLDVGGNFVDTANIYAGGTAESVVGALIGPHRDRIVLATKFGLPTDETDIGSGGSSYRALVRSVDQSLQRLGTDRIDLLWLHAWDGATPLDEVARALDHVVRSGKVLYVGVSDTPAWATAVIHTIGTMRTGTPLTAVQVRYSVLDRAAEIELLPMAATLGIGVTAFGVIGGGVLSGKYAAGGTGRRDPSSLKSREQAAAAVVQAVAERHGCTPTQVAVAWAMSAERSPVPILGARTLAQFEDAAGALDVALERADLDELGAVAPPPDLFPHDVVRAVHQQLRGGALYDRFDVERPTPEGGHRHFTL
jgi:aryl-alcohol dehydrogenase-like predicted oxidoreductase